MKVGILTYTDVHNHGAVLQANALRKVLLAKGHECEFLSFDRDYSMISNEQARKYRYGLGSIPFYFKYLYQRGIGNIIYNVGKKKILDKYRKNNLSCTCKYNSFLGDLVVIGSDEVFSLEIGINPYLYGNGIAAKKVISYAGSFGPTVVQDIYEKNLESMISCGLNKMKSISVRDMNSQSIVKEIADRQADIVCDPVILYGYREEMEKYRPPYKNYILLYSYDKNMNDIQDSEKILSYAKEKNMKIFSVGYYHKWCQNIQATPEELLGWIKNASIVVTDTFHGAVISIICNTPMIVKIRENKNKLCFLLEEYGLSDRIVKNMDNLSDVAEKNINFDIVNQTIEERRRYSIKYLVNAL